MLHPITVPAARRFQPHRTKSAELGTGNRRPGTVPSSVGNLSLVGKVQQATQIGPKTHLQSEEGPNRAKQNHRGLR